MWLRVAIVLVLGACGRIGFDRGADDGGDGGIIDAPADSTPDAFACPLTASPACPTGYLRGGPDNSCYRLATVPEQWYQAEEACENDGATSHLVVITSAAEQACVAALVEPYPAWIGLTNLVDPGEWRWVTGPVASFTTWSPGEPTSAGAERCASTQDSWSTPSCLEQKVYVCEDDGVAADPSAYGCAAAPDGTIGLLVLVISLAGRRARARTRTARGASAARSGGTTA